MFKLNSCVRLVDGTETTQLLTIEEKVCSEDVRAVSVDAISKVPFDPECALRIEIEPTEEIVEYMADYRDWVWWCKPFFGTELKDVPKETQALVMKKADGDFCVVLPVVNENYKCLLQGNENGKLSAEIFSHYDKLCTCRGLAFVYAIGKNPFRLIENCVKTALQLLNSGTRHISEREYPEIFEYLGWCSWDSMEIRVDEKGMLEKCQEFKDKNIPVKWAIFDDMWAEVRDFYGKKYEVRDDMFKLMHSSALYHFEADPIRFPNGLKNTIEKVNEYGIKAGIWHPVGGYWRGIDPEGKAYEILKDYLTETHDGKFVPDWEKKNSFMYFDTLHSFYRRAGAEFVKIDSQSIMDRYYKGKAPIGKIAKNFHCGLEASAGGNFGNAVINCMGMASENMWSRSISPISRCSDDFQPENREWFAKHILQCAYNSYVQGQFHFCDWDMWWTDDGQASKNSLMRAISGGPIYVSDKIGRSNGDILKPLALSDGRILRCDKCCVPTADCLTVDATKSKNALKLQNTVGEHGVMAVLNLDENNGAVAAEISPSMIEDVYSEEWAVYEHFSKTLKIVKHNESFDVELKDADDYRLYIFAPLKDGFAAIGRCDKFISPRTIDYVCGKTIKLVEDGPYAYVENYQLHFAE